MPKKRKLGRGCAIVGAGMCKFGVYPKGVRTTDLFVEAYKSLIESVDYGFDPKKIEALSLSSFSSDRFEDSTHLAPAMASQIGLVPIPAVRVEDACASGTIALREAILSIASGLYDVVLVVGAEKMTNLTTPLVTEVLASAGDQVTEIPAGQTFPGMYATIASAHMHKYGTTQEDLRQIAIKNHHNGSLNPYSHFDASIPQIMDRRAAAMVKKGYPEPKWKDEMEFLNDPKQNPVIAWPLHLFDCSTICDGAAAMLVAAEDVAKDFTDKPIHIIGTGLVSDEKLAERDDITSLRGTRLAAQEAFDMAELDVNDIDLAQVHDCFTIAELVALEDLGFYQPGQAVKAIRERENWIDGKLPINMDGGLKSKGHPVGVSGLAMIIELFKQMRGEGEERQIKNKDLNLGLAQSVGAHGSTVSVNIFERRS